MKLFSGEILLSLACKRGNVNHSKTRVSANYMFKGRFSPYVILFLLFMASGTVINGQAKGSLPENPFPSTIQFSPPLDSKNVDARALTSNAKVEQESILSIMRNGFSDFWVYNYSAANISRLLDFAQESGMGIDYMTSGFEGFGRNLPPAISVYSPDYGNKLERNIDSGLTPIKKIKNIYSVFPFQDEPFHHSAASFDYSKYAKAEFLKRYGYAMPIKPELVRNDPKKWLDLLNFQSNTFRDGWTQLYLAIKKFDPRPKIVMTNDSHNSFGAGVNSNSEVAMDDVYHWGGDFADVYAYDIYPYMTFDYRYGELGKLRKPRISQMHYTISQLRNLTTSYHKELGFWVGTYSEKWFSRFRGPERKNQYWSERELSYTAVAQGADFLISPSNYNTGNLPIDTLHWNDYSKSMRIIQKAGKGLLKAPKVKSKACFLFPRTQYLQLQEEYFNVGLTFELFLRAFGELDIIHEDQITDDKLKGYKVLVLADVKLLPEKVAKLISAYVRKGGIVIADCVPGMGEHKQPINEMKDLFGVMHSATNRILQQGQWVPFTDRPPKMSFPPEVITRTKIIKDSVRGNVFGHTYRFQVISPRNCELAVGNQQLRMESGQPALIVNKTGKGRTYLFCFCIQDTYFRTWKNNDITGRRQLQNLISDVFKNAKIISHIHSSNPDIEASIRANGKEGYLFIINHEATDSLTTVTLNDLPFTIAKIKDLENNKTIPFSNNKGTVSFVIHSGLGNTRLLKITPNKK